MEQLTTVIENLKSRDEVDAVFLAGSHAAGTQNSHSDFDVVIVLTENTKKIDSIFTWIGDIFADVIFFDHSDLDFFRGRTQGFSANERNTGKFLSWLEKSDIKFDKSGTLSALKTDVASFDLIVPQREREDVCQKINYNFVVNKRYFESGDVLYHEALEIRLLYSVMEVITGYFSLRNIPWRGEKAAISYLKERDRDFYGLFASYTKSAVLEEKFELYKEMTGRVFPLGFKHWSIGDVIATTKEPAGEEVKAEIVNYWKEISGLTSR